MASPPAGAAADDDAYGDYAPIAGGGGGSYGYGYGGYEDVPDQPKKAVVTSQSDIFAIGLIAAAMIAGATPRKLVKIGQIAPWMAATREGKLKDMLLNALDPAHPLFGVVDRCLCHQPHERPNATRLMDMLLDPALVTRCFPSPVNAAEAVAAFQHSLLLAGSRAHRKRYLQPFSTPSSTIMRVAEAGDSKLNPVLNAVNDFLSKPDKRVLVLLGDGGTGKSLTSHGMCMCMSVCVAV